MANSADPDQLASSEANWSGSTLFTKQGISGFSRTRVDVPLMSKWHFWHKGQINLKDHLSQHTKKRDLMIFPVFMPRHQKSGGVLCYTLWNFQCPSIHSAPTILLPATPPTVLGQSFSNFTGALTMVWRYA